MMRSAAAFLRSVLGSAAALAVPAVLVACAVAPDPAGAQSVEEGRQLAQARCAACHAIGATGASPRPAAPAFRDLHRRYPVDQLAEALAEGIVTGHPDMPEVSFDETQVTALIAYLRSLER